MNIDREARLTRRAGMRQRTTSSGSNVSSSSGVGAGLAEAVALQVVADELDLTNDTMALVMDDDNANNATVVPDVAATIAPVVTTGTTTDSSGSTGIP